MVCDMQASWRGDQDLAREAVQSISGTAASTQSRLQITSNKAGFQRNKPGA